MPLFLFTIGFFPSVLWLVYFLSRDRYNPEPPSTIAITFAFGMLSFLPAVWLETLGFNFLVNSGLYRAGIPKFWQSLVENVVLVGPVEEIVKWLPAFLFAYFRPEFDEPLDGIIYCLASALGFAAVENIKYLEQTGPQIILILIRGVLVNLGHAFFATIAGYGLGKAKFRRKGKWRFIVGFLALGGLAHGAYDLTIALIDDIWLRLTSLIALVTLLGYISNSAAHSAEKASAFFPKHSKGLILCSNCGGKMPSHLHACTRCGTKLHSKHTA